MTTTQHARQRTHPQRSSLQAVAPPLLALVVSSPAIVSGLSGSTAPLDVFTVVAVSMSAVWILFAAATHLSRRAPAAHSEPTEASEAHRAAGVPIGRIEPVRIPASEAIAGTPPPTSSMEGPIT